MARSKVKSRMAKISNDSNSNNNNNTGDGSTDFEGNNGAGNRTHQEGEEGSSTASTASSSSSERHPPFSNEVILAPAEDIRVAENYRPMTEEEWLAQQLQHLHPYIPKKPPADLKRYLGEKARVKIEYPKRDSTHNPAHRWEDYPPSEEETSTTTTTTTTSKRKGGRKKKKASTVLMEGAAAGTPLHGTQGRLSYWLLGIAREAPVGRQRQVIYGVAFNQWVGQTADVFATVGDHSVTVYQCSRHLPGCITALGNYYSPNETFYSADWSRGREPGVSTLVFAGDSGHVRMITFRPPGKKGKKEGKGGGEGGQSQHCLGSHPHAVNDVKVCRRDPELVATGAADHSLRLWNVEKRLLIAIFGGSEGPRNQVVSVAFHDLYPIVAGTGIDHSIHFWDLGTELLRQRLALARSYPKHPATFKPVHQHMPKWVTRDIHSNYVDCIAFWGNWVITRSVNEDIVLWRAGRNGEELMDLKYEIYNENLTVAPTTPPEWMRKQTPLARRLSGLSTVTLENSGEHDDRESAMDARRQRRLETVLEHRRIQQQCNLPKKRRDVGEEEEEEGGGEEVGEGGEEDGEREEYENQEMEIIPEVANTIRTRSRSATALREREERRESRGEEEEEGQNSSSSDSTYISAKGDEASRASTRRRSSSSSFAPSASTFASTKALQKTSTANSTRVLDDGQVASSSSSSSAALSTANGSSNNNPTVLLYDGQAPCSSKAAGDQSAVTSGGGDDDDDDASSKKSSSSSSSACSQDNGPRCSKVNIGPDVQLATKIVVKGSSSWFLRFGLDYEGKLLGFGNEVGDYSVFYLGAWSDQEALMSGEVEGTVEGEGSFERIRELKIPVFPEIANCFVRQVAFNYTGQLMVGVTDLCYVVLYQIRVNPLEPRRQSPPGTAAAAAAPRPDPRVGRIFLKAQARAQARAAATARAAVAAAAAAAEEEESAPTSASSFASSSSPLSTPPADASVELIELDD